MSYADKTEVENYLTINIDASFDSQINSWAQAVDNYIDNYTGRSFSETNKEVRYFDGNGESQLDIDDFTSVSSVEILEVNSTDVSKSLTQGKNDDYVVYPHNKNPKYRLILTPDANIGSFGNAGTFPRGKRRVKVKAKWGYDENVPEDITVAATMLLAGIIEEGLEGGNVEMEQLGDYRVEYNNVDKISNTMGVAEILDKYKEYTL